ncbi:MAG: hypothetical protein FWF59_11950 [Turicibacter sp.]|nr:hypothetical protein [Turicibacter sp.]
MFDMKEFLKTREVRFISTEEALKDVTPIDWSEEVLSGKAKIIITDVWVEEQEDV